MELASLRSRKSPLAEDQLTGEKRIGTRESSPESRRAFEDVAARIRDEIASGSLKPGDRLATERELAVQLGVSRGTVREAVRSLENSGLLFLKRGPSGGVFVARKDTGVLRKGVLDLLSLGVIEPGNLREARTIIGVAVARLAATRRTYGDLEALRVNIEQTLNAVVTENYNERIRLGYEFHQLMAKATQNPVLAILTDALLALNDAFLSLSVVTNPSINLTFKRKMFASLEAKDEESAAQTMKSYLVYLEKLYSAKKPGR
jgi:DNA-binding FadR family transcriptional regulator